MQNVSKFSVWPPPCRFRPKNRVPWYPQGLKKRRTRRLGFRKVSILPYFVTFWPFLTLLTFWSYFVFFILSLFSFSHFLHFVTFWVLWFLIISHFLTFLLIITLRPYYVGGGSFLHIGGSMIYVWWFSPLFVLPVLTGGRRNYVWWFSPLNLLLGFCLFYCWFRMSGRFTGRC